MAILYKEPDVLASLLADLGQLHAESVGRGSSTGYEGDPRLTRERLDVALVKVTPKRVLAHVKRVR